MKKQRVQGWFVTQALKSKQEFNCILIKLLLLLIGCITITTVQVLKQILLLYGVTL